jgi:signal transduction histidine kinase
MLSRLTKWIPEDQSSRGFRSPHPWAVLVLFIALTVVYYIDTFAIVRRSSLDLSFLTGVHDLHRTLFLIPIIYAAFVFRVRGTLAVCLGFFCIVLPRALFTSPYPNPLLRAMIAVASWTIIGVLVAAWLNRFEAERKTSADLAAAYEELREYHKRLEENQTMLIQAEKLASMGQLAASIAHEVNNPLSGVLVYIQLLTKKIAKGDINEVLMLDYLSKMDFEITRSARLIRNLLDFSSQSEPNVGEVNVNEVLNRALDLTIHAGSAATEVEKELQSVPTIIADPEQLEEVFINLIMNGIQAMPKGGTLTLRTYREGNEIRIAVQDTGCGIAPENMSKLFTPFFSTKKEVKGVGLGLSVSYGIIQRLQGRIEAASKAGEGSTFTVCIPMPQ